MGKWKRQAKKLLGACNKYQDSLCHGCTATELCEPIFGYTGDIPIEYGIRDIREMCKYNNICKNRRKKNGR